MLRKHGGFWLLLALVLGLVLGVSGLAVATPLGAPASVVRVAADGSDSGDGREDGDASDPNASDPDVSDPDASDPDAEPEPEPEPVVVATVSPDEKVVKLVAKDPSLKDATKVVFHVWNEGQGKRSLIRHEAVQQEDGSWVATAFIASNTYDDPGVPYSCQVLDAVHRLYNPYTKQHFFTVSLNEADTLSRRGWRYEGVAWVQPDESEAPDADDEPGIDPGTDATDPTAGEGEATDSTDSATPAVPSTGTGDENPGSNDSGTGADAPAAGGDEGTGTGDSTDPGNIADSEDSAAPKTEPVYRLLNPYSGDHLFTTDKGEYDRLGASGWTREDIAFTSNADEGMEVYRLYNPNLRVGAHLYTSDVNEYRTLVRGGWQDEGVAWYGDELNADGTWSAEAGNRFHDQPGTYAVEAVATVVPVVEPDEPDVPTVDPGTGDATVEAMAPATEDVTVGTAGFSISRPSATMGTANIDNTHGRFDVVVSGVRSASGIAHVYVPTWTDHGGQDDIVWYEAARQGDGSYRAHVDVARHTFNHEFTCHAYVKAGNGLMVNVAQLNQYVTLANFIKKEGGPYFYTVSVYNPGTVSRVQMPTWSDQGGQDDIVWFDAHDNGNGWWSAIIDAGRLLHSGTVHTHVYADGQYRGAVDYTIQPWEVLEWRYRNMNSRIWGLSSPTGYLLAVDTSNCFVGVYQGSQGNWRNRAWWACAPGTAYTPTVKGIFHVGSRGYSFGHGYTCYWWTQFYGDYLFHSIKYYEGTFNPMDPTLGSPASLGCVRLDISNAKWIHDNIPSGTTVLVY